MRSLIRVIKVLLFWTYEFVTFLAAFFAIDFSFRQMWGMATGLWILALLMRIAMKDVKNWAEKY